MCRFAAKFCEVFTHISIHVDTKPEVGGTLEAQQG